MKRIYCLIFAVMLSLASSLAFSQPWPFTGLPSWEKTTLNEANRLFAFGKYDEANEAIQSLYEDTGSVYRKQAKIFFSSADLNLPAVSETAVLLENGDFEKALQTADSFLKENPGNYYALLLRAEALSKLNPNKAVEECSRVLYYVPVDTNFLRRRATAYSSLGMYAEAINDCTLHLYFADDDFAHYCRGNAYRILGDSAKAKKDLSDSIRLNPNGCNPAYLERAIIYYEAEDFSKAKSDCEAYAKGGGKDENLFIILVAVHIAEDDYAEALEVCDKGLRLHHHSSKIYKTRGAVFFAMEQKENALADLNKALEYATTDSERAEIQALIQKVKGL